MLLQRHRSPLGVVVEESVALGRAVVGHVDCVRRLEAPHEARCSGADDCFGAFSRERRTEEPPSRDADEPGDKNIERLLSAPHECRPRLRRAVPASKYSSRVATNVGPDVLHQAVLGCPRTQTIDDALVGGGDDDSSKEPSAEGIYGRSPFRSDGRSTPTCSHRCVTRCCAHANPHVARVAPPVAGSDAVGPNTRRSSAAGRWPRAANGARRHCQVDLPPEFGVREQSGCHFSKVLTSAPPASYDLIRAPVRIVRNPGGPTPEASLNSAVTQDIKKREQAGESQRFRSHGRGFFSLARPSDPLRGAVDRKNLEVRARLRAVLGELHPQAFEHLIGELLLAIGFEDVVVTRYVGDKGIDLRATLVVGGITDVRTAIQVKRHTTGSIGAPAIRELRGGLGPHDRGLIITLSSFSKDSRREAAESDRSPISLVDGQELIELLVANRVGVTSSNVTILELDEGFFTDGADDDAAVTSSRPTDAALRRPRPPALAGKAMSLWPLPGGGRAWKETLDVMLKHVAAEAPTMKDGIDWLIQSYDRVASEKTARGYWQVLRSFGLVETRGEQMGVTALGSEYLGDPTDDHLLNIATDRVLGVAEMLEWLTQRPHTQSDLLARFREELAVEWESTAQIQFRLGWLSVLGAVRGAAGEWRSLTRD